MSESFKDGITTLRKFYRENPLLVTVLFSLVAFLAAGDILEIIPLTKEFTEQNGPYQYFHEVHDLLALAIALVIAYRWFPSLGTAALIVYLGCHLPYFYFTFPAHAVEHFRILVELAVAFFGIALISRLHLLAGLMKDRAKSAEHRVEHMTHHDQLTGLMSYSGLVEAAQDMLRHRILSAVLCIKIPTDALEISDSLASVDLALVQVANHLDDCLHPGDRLCRSHGGEFFAILTGRHSESHAEATARRIVSASREPLIIAGVDLLLRPRLGIALADRDGDTVEELMRNATLAAATAVAEGKSIASFSHDSAVRQVERARILSALRTAVDRDEFRLVYQPRVSISTGLIVGAEALLRWEHPEMGAIPPGVFIPLAEESELITSIGEWVLWAAAAQTKSWNDRGADVQFHMSLNVSFRQLANPGFVPLVRQVINEFGLEPQLIELEITETLAIENLDRIDKSLQALRRLGVRTSIDDFGTGYGSLTSLSKLKVDAIKIDGSFVRQLDQDRTVAQIVSMITILAHRMGMRTVAEQVESDAQLQTLKRLNVSEAQGYLFGMPLEVDDFTAILGWSATQQIDRFATASG